MGLSDRTSEKREGWWQGIQARAGEKPEAREGDDGNERRARARESGVMPHKKAPDFANN